MTPPSRNQESFQTTRWSMVLDAARENTEPGDPSNDARQALEELCRIYWYPLYAFARRRGESPEAAMDATQGFFADLLEKSWINRADPARGRFRAYLITVFRRFLSDERKRNHALKRGGGLKTFSIDAAGAEERYQLEPVDHTAPDAVFERRWALALLDRVYSQLREEYAKKNRLDLFESLQQYLTLADPLPYATVAEKTGMSVNNVKVAVHRLRQRYRRILELEVGQTVESAADIDSELNALLAALSRQ